MALTRDDVLDLLKVIVGYDKRTVGESDVDVWSEAARRGRWSLPEALEAVHAYHLDHEAMIKPVHVHRAIRAGRRDALDRAAVPSQAPDPTLMRRLEALADAKAVDAPAPVRALPSGGRGHGRVEEVVAAAMRRGEQARAQHAAAAVDVPDPQSHEPTGGAA